jgi:hypothetical protein
VIETELITVRGLEDSGESLVALSDYVQKKIKEDHERGRFVQAHELEDYLTDFFERNFPGTELNHNTPAEGCMRLRLSFEAQSSLAEYIRDDHSLSARHLRQRELSITFQREALSRLPAHQRNSVNFINHLSPLIRWITQINQLSDHDFQKVSALSLETEKHPVGSYVYRLQRWLFKGLSPRDSMSYAVINLETGKTLSENESEAVVQAVLREGSDWDYAQWDGDELLEGYGDLSEALDERFDDAFETFEAENETTIQVRVQRASNHWNRLIGQSEQAIQTMQVAGRKESIIRGRQTRLKNEMEHKAQRISVLKQGGETDMEQQDIAAGIFRIMKPN